MLRQNFEQSIEVAMNWLGSAVCLAVSGRYLSHLTGRGTLRNLISSGNVDDALYRLTAITSYSHLLNLENLDISHNEVDSLRRELVFLIAKRSYL